MFRAVHTLSDGHHTPQGLIPPETGEKATGERKPRALGEGEEGHDVEEEFEGELEDRGRLRGLVIFAVASSSHSSTISSDLDISIVDDYLDYGS